MTTNLYFIKARWGDSDGVENRDLWVRAATTKDAFTLWSEYYELSEENDDGSPYTRAQAEDFYDEGFKIEKKKRYAYAQPAGVVSWDEYEARLVGAL